MNIFTTRLNEQLAINKITMYKLAKALNKNKQTVINWCTGINEPKISQLKELCEYFDISADYLLGLKEY